MTSKSSLSYVQRARQHSHPLVRSLFKIAAFKKTNIVLSADVTYTSELLDIAEKVGPYIAVLKTHADMIKDFGPATVNCLRILSQKHKFFIFEDRKFIDRGQVVQSQYCDGALQISQWAHIINATVLDGTETVASLTQVSRLDKFRSLRTKGRGVLIVAEMTGYKTLARENYTKRSIEVARAYPDFVIGFVATKSLLNFRGEDDSSNEDFLSSEGCSSKDCSSDEDFVIFATGVSLTAIDHHPGQQYYSPSSVIAKGADFIICGKGIYAADDPVLAAKKYQVEGWKAYRRRTSQPV